MSEQVYTKVTLEFNTSEYCSQDLDSILDQVFKILEVAGIGHVNVKINADISFIEKGDQQSEMTTLRTISYTTYEG